MFRFRFVAFVLFSIGLFFVFDASAQCDTFLPNGCKSALRDFIHDGNNNGAELCEGETAELFKMFQAGQTYRMVVCKSDNLPSVHIRVVDNSGRILFDNKNFNFEQIWDFSVKSTQMLVIQMKVNKRPNATLNTKNKGCVSIVFGIDEND